MTESLSGLQRCLLNDFRLAGEAGIKTDVIFDKDVRGTHRGYYTAMVGAVSQSYLYCKDDDPHTLILSALGLATLESK